MYYFQHASMELTCYMMIIGFESYNDFNIGFLVSIQVLWREETTFSRT